MGQAESRPLQRNSHPDPRPLTPDAVQDVLVVPKPYVERSVIPDLPPTRPGRYKPSLDPNSRTAERLAPIHANEVPCTSVAPTPIALIPC